MLAPITFRDIRFLKNLGTITRAMTCINVIVKNVNVEDSPKAVFFDLAESRWC